MRRFDATKGPDDTAESFGRLEELGRDPQALSRLHAKTSAYAPPVVPCPGPSPKTGSSSHQRKGKRWRVEQTLNPDVCIHRS